MALQGKRAFITGASTGIGAATAHKLASLGASLFLFARNEHNLATLSSEILSKYPSAHIFHEAGDIQSNQTCVDAVKSAVQKLGGIDILVNNAGLALGAPAPFWKLSMDQIDQMNNTNISGTMYVTHAVLNLAFMPSGAQGIIINVSSITGLNAPPFPGEVVYHTNKAGLEGFSNALRNELTGTDIKVLVVRPGPVGNHFHQQRVGYDQASYDDFFKGYEPLVSEDIAETIAAVLQTPLRVSWTAIDCLPTAVRSMYVLDREWSTRHPEQ